MTEAVEDVNNDLRNIGEHVVNESTIHSLVISQVKMYDLIRDMGLRISKKQLECLPNCISNLENFSGLFLQGCEHISCLPTLEKLRALRVLNIEGCKGIREFPQDMGCLVSLQYLYMRGTSNLKEIPKGVISKLRNLKCLQLQYCPSLQSEEVNCLPYLQQFTNCYDELHSFNKLVKKLEQLERYAICVGWGYSLEIERRTVDFHGISFKGKRGQEIKVLLPANITDLGIKGCEGLNGCIADYFQSMSNLRTLLVHDCKEVEWIFNSEQITRATPPFQSLEQLFLSSLPKLLCVCKGEDVILQDCTFSFLIHLSMKKALQYCRQLVVIGDGDEEAIGSSNTTPLYSSSNILYLPKFKHLKLLELPELKSICNGREMICPSVERIAIRGCKNVKKMPSLLPINGAAGQPYLSSSFQGINLAKDEKEWWESLEWHNPDAKDILDESHIKWGDC